MHDGSSICEIVALTIEKVYRIAQETNRVMPTTLLLGSDNMVREAKNQITLHLLANLVSQYKFRASGLVNLRKSHTHDKLDQFPVTIKKFVHATFLGGGSSFFS